MAFKLSFTPALRTPAEPCQSLVNLSHHWSHPIIDGIFVFTETLRMELLLFYQRGEVVAIFLKIFCHVLYENKQT